MESYEEISAITFKTLLSIWWSMMWRAVLASMLVGFILGLILGLIVVAAGRTELVLFLAPLLGMLGSLPAHIWALKAALSRKHGDYSVVLVKSS